MTLLVGLNSKPLSQIGHNAEAHKGLTSVADEGPLFLEALMIEETFDTNEHCCNSGYKALSNCGVTTDTTTGLKIVNHEDLTPNWTPVRTRVTLAGLGYILIPLNSMDLQAHNA